MAEYTFHIWSHVKIAILIKCRFFPQESLLQLTQLLRDLYLSMWSVALQRRGFILAIVCIWASWSNSHGSVWFRIILEWLLTSLCRGREVWQNLRPGRRGIPSSNSHWHSSSELCSLMKGRCGVKANILEACTCHRVSTSPRDLPFSRFLLC